jgi:hypothetical protein
MESQHDKTTASSFWASLGADWRTFGKIVLNPWVAIFLILTIAFVIVKVRIPSTATIPRSIDVTLEIVISILAGIVGALLMQGWDKVKQQSILVTRGQSAIRGLRLLSNSIYRFEERVKHQLKVLSDNEQSHVLIQSNYDEIIDRCNLLQEEVIDAIEDWQDIIPEVANLKTQIGVIGQLQARESRLADQVSQINGELESVQAEKTSQEGELEALRSKSGADEKEVNRLSAQLKKIESRSQALTKQLEEKEQELTEVRGNISGTRFLGTVRSNTDIPSFGSVITYPMTPAAFAEGLVLKKCNVCGYESGWGSKSPRGIVTLCPKCNQGTLG